MAKKSCHFITIIIIFCFFKIPLEHQSNEKGFTDFFGHFTYKGYPSAVM